MNFTNDDYDNRLYYHLELDKKIQSKLDGANIQFEKNGSFIILYVDDTKYFFKESRENNSFVYSHDVEEIPIELKKIKTTKYVEDTNSQQPLKHTIPTQKTTNSLQKSIKKPIPPQEEHNKPVSKPVKDVIKKENKPVQKPVEVVIKKENKPVQKPVEVVNTKEHKAIKEETQKQTSMDRESKKTRPAETTKKPRPPASSKEDEPINPLKVTISLSNPKKVKKEELKEELKKIVNYLNDIQKQFNELLVNYPSNPDDERVRSLYKNCEKEFFEKKKRYHELQKELKSYVF
ncbi:hypothetical protein QTN25_003746 [Entamoeba marina]